VRNKVYAVVFRLCFTELSWTALFINYYSSQASKWPRSDTFILHTCILVFCLSTYSVIRSLLHFTKLTMLNFFLLRNSNIHHNIHNSLPLDPILRQVQSTWSRLAQYNRNFSFTIYIILPSIHMTSMLSPSFRPLD
jgi:hypothetical protein